jgi:hypothetical protein
VLAWTERTVRVAVAPPRSRDHRVGVVRGETSLQESPPVPMSTIDSLVWLPAG